MVPYPFLQIPPSLSGNATCSGWHHPCLETNLDHTTVWPLAPIFLVIIQLLLNLMAQSLFSLEDCDPHESRTVLSFLLLYLLHKTQIGKG